MKILFKILIKILAKNSYQCDALVYAKLLLLDHPDSQMPYFQLSLMLVYQLPFIRNFAVFNSKPQFMSTFAVYQIIY